MNPHEPAVRIRDAHHCPDLLPAGLSSVLSGSSTGARWRVLEVVGRAVGPILVTVAGKKKCIQGQPILKEWGSQEPGWCARRERVWKMVGLAGCCARSAREGKDRGENTGFTAAGLLRQAKEGIRKMVGLQREVPAWHKRLSERLGGDVHMVGPTISCEGTPRDGGPAAEWRTLPHVQSHAIAVDQVLLTHLSANLWVILPSPVCIVKVAHAAACALTCHRLQ